MLWEAERYDWPSIRAMGSATHVPRAITQLQLAQSDAAASSAYWTIDNVVVVQGQLYDAAGPTAHCLVVALQSATELARPYILELLVQIAIGEISDDELREGNSDLKLKCHMGLASGMATFYFLLQHGTPDEQASCVDILGSIARYVRSFHDEILWYLRRAAASSIDPAASTLVGNWLKVLDESA